MSDLPVVALEYDLALVILFGSRAKETARPDSDYDVGVLKREGALEADELLVLTQDLSQALRLAGIDLVDLRRASPLLKYEAARSTRVLYEAAPGTFNLFHVLAWKMYQDDRYDLRRLDRIYVDSVMEKLARDQD